MQTAQTPGNKRREGHRNMKKWKYMFYRVKADEPNEFTINVDLMNDLGKKGWELINTVTLPVAILFIYKRQL